MVKELREKTDVPMMKAKQALVDVGGDMEAAIQKLREENSKIQPKEGRVSAEGVVDAFVREHGKLGVLIELNSETDFVARNEEFVALARFLAAHAGSNPTAATVDELLDKAHHETGSPARDRLQEALAKLRENIVFKRFTAYETADGTVGSYIHSNAQIGVLVELSGEGPQVQALAREVAMQVCAAKPHYLSREDVPAAVIESEREIARANVMNDERNASKPAAIIEKIVEGGLTSFYKGAVLLEQPYIREPKQSVAQFLGSIAQVRRFVRYEIGEA
jgi:elongation factor Ts